MLSTNALSGCLSNDTTPPDVFHGEDIMGGDTEYLVPAFTLSSHDGTTVNLSDYEGKVVIVSFVYTRCPDVCPAVSASLAWTLEALGGNYGEDVAILSITVDPWFDSETVLNDYAVGRNLSWPHLRGEVEDLEPIWESFHVGLRTYLNDSNEEDNGTEGRSAARHHPDYLVDHSTATIIIDRNHIQRVFWGDQDWVPELFLDDVHALIAE